MQTKRGLIQETTEQQVVLHPELDSINTELRTLASRVDAIESISIKIDALSAKMDLQTEADRDNIAMLLSAFQKAIDDLKSGLVKK